MTHGDTYATQEEAQDLAGLRIAYQEVFDSIPGKRVLADILTLFGYWEHNAEDPELRRAAIILMERGGWLHEKNINAIVDGYMKTRQVNEVKILSQEEQRQ